MAAGGGARPGEFALIERYFKPLATDPGAYGLLDDAATYAPPAGEELVLKTDMIAAGIHFFADDPPASIARKALRVNLSDLAAKGAVPVGYLLSIALPANWTEDWIAGFADGLRGDQERYGLSLLGGDTNRAPSALTISVAAIGRVPTGGMVKRSGARAGDLIYVTGTIGDAALGLRLRLDTIDPTPAGEGVTHLLDRYLHPQPRLALGAMLRRYASASMDVSDGLIGDFGHICKASSITGEIEAARVPLSEPARALVAADPSLLATVLTGGDDYEILVTVADSAAAAFEREAAAAGVAVTRIGRVVRGAGAPRVLAPDGRPLGLTGVGHTHF
jgi:thiamine-monophosphate kinase